jgi:hypothetical protein
MKNEHRTEPREQIQLPVGLVGGQQTLTRDISATGLFFEMDSVQQVGGLIDLEIDLDTPGGPMRLKAQGQIVRIEPQGGKTGVGVKLLSSRLEPVE